MTDDRPTSPPPADELPIESPRDEDTEFKSRLAAAWDCARRSEFEEAYRGLQSLGSEYPDREAPYLGRYWLLRLNSKLDPDRRPCDELCECLIGVRSGSSAAWELYRREIERTPEESLSERCTRLLRESTVEGAALALAQARWQEASRQGRWDLIRDDLAALRATPSVREPASWHRLLRSAMEASLWDSRPQAVEIYDACAGELRAAAGVGPESTSPPPDSFVDVADDVRKLRLRNVPPAFLRIVAHSWSNSPADLYLQSATFFSAWVDNHGPLIRMLDEVRAEGGTVLDRFAEVLRLVARELGRDAASSGSTETDLPVVSEFLAGPVWRHYDAHFRTALLRFCLYQRLSVRRFSAAVRGDARYAAPERHLAESAEADLPLECAYEAIRLIDG